MAIAEDLTLLERMLGDLIIRYEQYFIGLEKREPLQLLADVEKMVRHYTGIPITNTMYKHKYTMMVARLNSYREHWNRILRLIEEGRYSRDRFIRDLHQRQHAVASRSENLQQHGENGLSRDTGQQLRDTDLDRIYQEYREARRSCNLPVENLSPELLSATINKKKPGLVARLGTEDLVFRVVVENGKPKIKASQRK